MMKLLKFFEEYAKNKSAEPPINALRSAVELACGAAPEVLSWDSASVVKEPRFWMLYFNSKVPGVDGGAGRDCRLCDVRDEVGGPGRVLIGWLLRAEELWLLPCMDDSLLTLQRQRLVRLRRSFVLLATCYFGYPSAKSAVMMLKDLRPLLEQADAEVAELDDAVIGATVGQKQQKEIARLRQLDYELWAPKTADLVSRLSFRGGGTDGDKDRELEDPSATRKRPRGGSGNKSSKNKKQRIPAEDWQKMTDDQKKEVIEKRRNQKRK